MYFNKTCYKRKNRRRNIHKSQMKGSHSKRAWERLKKKHDFKCLMCESENLFLTRDHIVPVSKSGNNSIDNIQPLCYSCNNLKGRLRLDIELLDDAIAQWFRWLAC